MKTPQARVRSAPASQSGDEQNLGTLGSRPRFPHVWRPGYPESLIPNGTKACQFFASAAESYR